MTDMNVVGVDRYVPTYRRDQTVGHRAGRVLYRGAVTAQGKTSQHSLVLTQLNG